MLEKEEEGKLEHKDDKDVSFVEVRQSARIVSLWKMLDLYAENFFNIRGLMCIATESMKTALLDPKKPDGMRHAIERCREVLPKVRQLVASLNLSTSVDSCDYILRLIPVKTPVGQEWIYCIEIESMMAGLHKTIASELHKEWFYWVQQGYVKYYWRRQFTDADVEIVGDPTDMDEAGKCLALGRATACVFHLSRVIQAALNWLTARFEFDYSPTWDTICTRMRRARDERREAARKNPNTNDAQRLRDEADYLAGIEAKCHAIKDAWRNDIVHNPARQYDQEEAENLFRDTQGFMAAVSRGS